MPSGKTGPQSYTKVGVEQHGTNFGERKGLKKELSGQRTNILFIHMMQ